MLDLAHNWFKGLSAFAPKANPIGIDFGTDCLRTAQIRWEKEEPVLIAAASAEVPGHIRNNAAARLAFFTETTKDLLAQGGFRGRQTVLALPAAAMYIQHLRLPRMDDAMLRKALPWEARGKLPIDPSHALLRHLVAGEVYDGQDQKQEVILMAAARDVIDQLLAAAAKARLDVIGMNVEPLATVACFGHIYRRKDDAATVNCFVDIGCGGSRAVIAQGSQILFARSIRIGGEHFNRAVANAMKIGVDEAKMLRIKLSHLNPCLDEHRQRQEIANAMSPQDAARAQAERELEDELVTPPPGMRASAGGKVRTEREGTSNDGGAAGATATLAPVARGGRGQSEGGGIAGAGAGSRNSDGIPATGDRRAGSREGMEHTAKLAGHFPTDPVQQAQFIEAACREPLSQLSEELDLCRRYHETTFPNKPVDRLIFVGGEAKQRSLCQDVAREMSLAAQVGDPLVRMGRTTGVSIDSGIDRRQPQPGWVVAIGLSLGPVAGSEEGAGQ